MQPTIKQILQGPYTFSQRVRFLYRFFKWQFTDKVLKRTMIFNFTPDSKLLLMNSFEALSGNYYFGLADPDIMPFVVHVLRPGDLFIDVGANGGAYTVLASGEKKASTIAIEAAAHVFKGLEKNIEINRIGHLAQALNVALSDIDGTLPFSSTGYATGRVCYDEGADIINVPAKTLDVILNGRVPLLIKMDIEGHEHNALLGAHDTISSVGCKAIVMEFSNTGEYYGYGNTATHQLLTGYGFKPYKYNYQNKELIAFDPLTTRFEFNMIYIKEELFIKDRLNKADHIMMSGELI